MVTNIKRKNQFFKRFFGKTKGDKIFSCFNYLFFLLVAFVTFYPFYYVVKTSLKVHNVSSGVAVVVYNFNAYKTIFENDGIVNAFLLIANVKDYVHIRKYYNYIKAQLQGITGNISNTARNDLRQRFASGIRFWNQDEISYQYEN